MMIIWGWNACPSCDHAKDFLEKQGIPYEEKLLYVDFDIDELKEATGGKRGVPQFFIDDKYIGGYEYVYHNIEKIKEML